MKTKAKKLQMNRETLRTLDAMKLAAVQGGSDGGDTGMGTGAGPGKCTGGYSGCAKTAKAF